MTEPTLKMEVAKNKEEQIMPISEKNSESNLVALKASTPTLATSFLEETGFTSNNLLSTNLHQDDRTESINRLGFYFNPFLNGMSMWQAWLDMYNEFATISTRLSINWFNLLWKVSFHDLLC